MQARQSDSCPFSAAAPVSAAAAAAVEARPSRRALLLGVGALVSAPAWWRTPAAAAAPKKAAAAAAATTTRRAARGGHAAALRGLDIASTGRDKEARFGLMFKKAPAFAPDDALLSDLGGKLMDPRAAGAEPSDGDALDNHAIPAGYTFFGQFVDHDMTRDTTPLTEQTQDPRAMTNYDTPFFDLGSVYGRGPALDPELYDAAPAGIHGRGAARRPRRPAAGRHRRRLPGRPAQRREHHRRPGARAVPQAAQLVHGRRPRLRAGAAATRWHFQHLIVNDFLPRICGQDVVNSVLRTKSNGTVEYRGKLYKPKNPNRPMMPVEYSAAAYRFGHSMVRPEYEMNDADTGQVFGEEGKDLRGSRPIPGNFKADWTYFFDVPGREVPEGKNFARRIDPLLAFPLHSLPHTVVAAAPVNLAERNLLRAKRCGVSSGQDVARAMGVRPLSNAELSTDGIDLTDPAWGDGAPLWFYVLREAQLQQGGARLGEVGGRLVAETILGILAADKGSYFNAKGTFEPVRRTFTMGDLVDVLDA